MLLFRLKMKKRMNELWWWEAREFFVIFFLLLLPSPLALSLSSHYRLIRYFGIILSFIFFVLCLEFVAPKIVKWVIKTNESLSFLEISYGVASAACYRSRVRSRPISSCSSVVAYSTAWLRLWFNMNMLLVLNYSFVPFMMGSLGSSSLRGCERKVNAHYLLLWWLVRDLKQ